MGSKISHHGGGYNRDALGNALSLAKKKKKKKEKKKKERKKKNAITNLNGERKKSAQS